MQSTRLSRPSSTTAIETGLFRWEDWIANSSCSCPIWARSFFSSSPFPGFIGAGALCTGVPEAGAAGTESDFSGSRAFPIRSQNPFPPDIGPAGRPQILQRMVFSSMGFPQYLQNMVLLLLHQFRGEPQT